MATAAQIAANRANAEKSTGPKSEDGKARSSQNALKHGLCAERLLLDGEDPEAWEALRADYLARLAPHGEAEERLVDRIAQLAFRRERGSVAEAAAWRGYTRGGWIVDKRGKQRWDEDRDPVVAERATPIMNGVMAELLRITGYESRLSRELARLKAELAELQKQRRELAAAERAREADAAWRARQAAEKAAERAAVEGRAAALAEGRVPAPEPPPSAGAPLAAIHDWVEREQARLDAPLRVFRAARQSQVRPAA